MESRNTYLLQDTESFMRGELDNVTVSEGRILLDIVQGTYVPYGCYTSPAIPMPLFDMLRVSWNAATPRGTAVEAQARVVVDGNWSSWFSFGKWSPHMKREGAKPATRGPVVLSHDMLALDSKEGELVQMRIYLYTKEAKATPAVTLLCASVHPMDCIPAGGRPVNAALHTMPYSLARRPGLPAAETGLGIGIASLVNRWGADLLPEEFALLLQDYSLPHGAVNLAFAAAAAGCQGFPAWVCWGDLALLRSEMRAGYGAVAVLQATAAQQRDGLPEHRFVTVRGFAVQDGVSCILLDDPWAAGADFDVETAMPLDDFLVAWNNVALFVRKRLRSFTGADVQHINVTLRHTDAEPEGIYRIYRNGEAVLLPDNFCGDLPAPQASHAEAAEAANPSEEANPAEATEPESNAAEPTAAPAEKAEKSPRPCGVVAWSIPDERPHATTAHCCLHFCRPEQGGIRLERTPGEFLKYTVYIIDYTGRMMVSDVMV